MKCGKKKRKRSAPGKYYEYSGREESGTDGANADHSRHGFFASARPAVPVEDVAAWPKDFDLN
jgi:hypothetical protein